MATNYWSKVRQMNTIEDVYQMGIEDIDKEKLMEDLVRVQMMKDNNDLLGFQLII